LIERVLRGLSPWRAKWVHDNIVHMYAKCGPLVKAFRLYFRALLCLSERLLSVQL